MEKARGVGMGRYPLLVRVRKHETQDVFESQSVAEGDRRLDQPW